MHLDNIESISVSASAERNSGTIRIGLISDTHIPSVSKILPPHVKEALKGSDLILHAGDIYLPKVLDDLESIAPVLAAHGNDDGDFPQDQRIKNNHIISINGFSLGLTHRGYWPRPLHNSRDEIITREFGRLVDIVVYGDSHVAMVESYNNTLLVNPGSPTSPGHVLKLGTVGLLEITGNM
ncbi:MAG: metallophosphoesterase family protein, partial [Chloroflexi bacterium]|nr:metallophosphoesterase family protein [Chloroflexota bacterium]